MPTRSAPRRPRVVRLRSTAGLLSLAVAAVLAIGLAGCQPRLSLANLDRMVYDRSLPEFRRWWLAQQAELRHTSVGVVERWLDDAPDRLDDARSRSGTWDLSTDRCSASPDRGPGFDFRWPCIRHDLAWRNLKRLDRQRGGGIDTRAQRIRASNRFLDDLLTTCAPRPLVQRTACRALARTYHRVVVLAS